jgi:hypothetical protein
MAADNNSVVGLPTATDDIVILEAAVDSPTPALGVDEAAVASKSTELFRNLFEKLDLKRDGRIDAEELVVGLHNMGYLHLSQAGHRHPPPPIDRTATPPPSGVTFQYKILYFFPKAIISYFS